MPRHHELITPENLVIRHRLAGLTNRSLAALYDFWWQAMLSAVVSVGVVAICESRMFHYVLEPYMEFMIAGAVFMVLVLTHTFYEAFGGGQSPGKKQYGLRVLNTDGSRVDFFPAFVRNLLRVVDFMPVGFAAGLVIMFLTEREQRFGDLLAGTVVVTDRPIG